MTRFHVLVPLSLLLVPALRAQDDSESAARARSLEKRRSLLQQQPTHLALFDSYFKILVASNAVDDEVKTLQDKLAKDSADSASSVILGRILLRTGKEEQALEVLDAIPSKTAEIQGVLGDIYLKLARFDMATRALEASMPAARTSEAKAGVLEKLGKAQLSLKQKEIAVATWRKIGALDGGKFFRRLRVAELLAQAGLLDEAAAEYAPLLAESEGDPSQHCRVLRATGQLHETRGDLPAAMTAYQRVLELTDRGNWLRKEVEGRLVQIYRRTGRLPELVQQLEGRLAENQDDLATVEMLAAVLTEMRELDKATSVLAKAAPRFPKDVRLARRLAELYLEQDKVDLAIAEYQRVLSVKPDEMELYLELGQLFAKNERFAEAKNQWEKALARNLTDASLCTRIAAMYAMWNRYEDAVRMYERAVELEPEAMVRYTDLADYHFAQKHTDDAVAVLDRAMAVAKGKPRRLEALVGTLREHELADRARTCLEDWLAAEPDNAEARYGLADLLLAAGDVDAARGLLWKIVEDDDRGSGHRALAANTLIEVANRAKQMDGLIEEATARNSAGAYFVLGRAHTRKRDFERAIAAFRQALDKQPEDGQARVMLARLLAEDGAFQSALAEYQRLAMTSDSERRRHFREIARLHLDLFDLDAAIEVWRSAMRDNPDNPAVFLEVGKEFIEIQRVPEALEAFQQAVRLRPNDPDIQFRLADALKQAGKVEEAESQLLNVAKSALDTRDREQARSRLFDMYGEQGLIEKRIDELRARVEENPYDTDAPQLLGDIFMRTGDYVLGLEMVDKTLAFQPRNRELLTRRAELLEALEDWDKALEVHRELLKFPDADRDTHLAGIGQALYELGRAQEAKETFRQIRDRGKVAKLYAKYELHDEAIEYYQRAIARSPADLKSYVLLAEGLVKRNMRKEAIDALERALTVRSFHREALQELGKLYVQDGRPDDAVRVGMRLFGLRGEQVEKDRREEYEQEQEQKRNQWWSYYNNRSFNQQRLDAASNYFEERGLAQQWGEILVAEAKRRPADEVLLNNVVSHFSWRDKSATKLSAFLRSILATDEARLRVPPGHTKRSYLQNVEQRLVNVWQQDAAVAEARLTELAAETSVAALRERAMLQRSVGQLDAMEASLRELLAAEPLDGLALAMLVDRLLEDKRYDDCVAPLQSLLRFWESPAGEEALAELERRETEQFRRRRKDLLDSLPRKVRRRIDDAFLLAVVQRTQGDSSWNRITSFSFAESTPRRLAVACKLVRVQKARGDEAGLAAAVAATIALPTNIAERTQAARELFEEGQDAAARPLLDAVMAEGRAAQKDSTLVYFWSRYKGFVDNAAECLGQLLAREGNVLDAYSVLRDHGHGEKAELLVREQGAVDAVRQKLESGIQAGAEALRQARGAGESDTSSLELDYRDAVIKLADFHMGEKDFKAAERIYVDALQLLPDDLDVRKIVAVLRLRSGDAEGAVAAQNEIIDVKRQRRRANAGDTAIPPTRLVPTVPGESSESSITYTGYYYYGSSSGAQRRFDVAENYLAILNIYRDRNDHEAVLELLKRMTRDDPTTFRQMAWQVLDIVRNQDLGKRKLSILRILKGVVANDEWLQIEYARACSEEGELKEAKRTLEKMIAGTSTSNNWYIEEANQELTKVEQKLGEHKLTVADLRAEVDKDPENVRRRLKFAERLRKDNHYEDCLAQAQAVVERAPYLARAKELVVEAAAASGKDDVALAMMRRLFDETTESWKKLDRGVSLANWLYAEGQRDEAFQIIEGLESASGGSYNFSPGNWFLDRHMQDKALPLLEQELEKQKTNPWYRDQIRPRLIRIELSLGHEAKAVRRLLEDIDNAGSLSDRELRWKDLLRAIKGAPDPEHMRSVLEKDFGGRKAATDCLVMAAVEFACGRPQQGEAELEQALQLSSKDVHLFPLILGLRRMNADYTGALAVLDRMSKVYGGSDAQQWYAGSLNERDRLRVERATIMWDMGKDDDAKRLVESLADDTKPQTLLTVAQVYSQRKMWEDALTWRRRYFAKKGTRDKSDYLAEASILVELERYPEALELAKQAHLMSRGDNSARSTLTKIHREMKTLDAWIEELEQEYAKDIRDSGLRGSLLSLYGELDRDEDRRKVYEAMLAHPDLKDEALNGLIDLCGETDDYKGQLGFMQQRVELKGGEEKKSLWREIAGVLTKLEQPKEAREAMEKALDLETADGWMELSNWLDSDKRDAEALEAARKALELDPKKHEVLAKEAAAAHKAKDFATALDKALAYLREMRGKANPGSYQSLFLNALAAMPDDQRAAVLRGDEADAASLERAAQLQVARLDWPAAEAVARRAVAADPSSFLALQALATSLRQQERWRDRIDALEALRVLIEREYMISADWSYNSNAQTLQDEIGRAWHLLGDDDAAERAWRDQPLRKTPYNNNTSSWRSDWSVRYTADKWMGVLRPARALKVLETEFLQRESPPWDLYLTALVDTGRGDEAEAIAWKTALDPLELYGVTARVGGSDSYYYGNRDMSSSEGMMRFLIDRYRRRGQLDDLRARGVELQKTPATKIQGEKLEALVAERARDYRFLAEAAEKKIEQSAERNEKPQASTHIDAARRWLAAGEIDKALAHMREVLDFDSPGLRDPKMRISQSDYEYERVYYGASGVPQGGTSNPFAFSFGGSSGRSSYSYSSWRRSGGSVGYRALAASLLRRADDDAKAQEVEDALSTEARRSQRRDVATKIGQAYADAELWPHAVRVWRSCLDRADELELETKDKIDYCSKIWGVLERSGAADETVTALQTEWQQMLETAVTEAPGPYAFGEKAALARFFLEVRQDPAQADPLVVELLSFDPDNASYLAMQARTQRLLGKAEDAIATFARLAEERRRAGRGKMKSASERIDLGLALLAAGQKEEARAELVEGLADAAPHSRLEREAKAGLEQLDSASDR
ncbi:MAG: tetratricopeptide repeat protein [Planctomycetota bacterium]